MNFKNKNNALTLLYIAKIALIIKINNFGIQKIHDLSLKIYKRTIKTFFL